MEKKVAEAIGVRIEGSFLKTIDKLSREESTDRSTLLRKFISTGFQEYMKKRAKEQYLAKKCTLSGAAKIAGLTIGEMQTFLIEQGYKSQYSIEDLEEDVKKLSSL